MNGLHRTMLSGEKKKKSQTQKGAYILYNRAYSKIIEIIENRSVVVRR